MASFSIRCVFRLKRRSEQRLKHLYEERITLWQAEHMDAAIGMAEQEAERYVESPDEEFLGFSQAFELFDQIDASGVEVFSLLRESDLEPTDYLAAFYDTGLERQSSCGSPAQDCEARGGQHSWHNKDDVNSACYHCGTVKFGRLWESPDA